jgi:ElaB/YqjD/DUF883 family membrane-anchored ribosome-binding protein
MHKPGTPRGRRFIAAVKFLEPCATEPLTKGTPERKRGTRVLPVKFQPQENEPWRKVHATVAGQTLRTRPTDQLKKVADRVEGVAGAAADQMRDVTDRTGEVAGNFKRAVDKSVKEQPMTTLVMAAAIGFVLGALWKS